MDDPKYVDASRWQKAEDLAKVKQTEEDFLTRYSYKNAIQSPEQENKLQYLIGRTFIDSDNKGLYEISEVLYNSDYEVVVGKRRLWKARL